MHDNHSGKKLGIVVIGRNEGDRLVRCLRSVVDRGALVVYVDSGSTDGSPRRARESGAYVVELDATRPFTAARARNEGFRRLSEIEPDLDYVQFVDGDCEVVAGWIGRAMDTLAGDDTLAAVCGRRREREPDASAYNMMCDLEWDTPVGECQAFGGDVMVRADDFDAAGGYDATLIAGEDPDLSLRLRSAGKKLLRIDADMTIHDAQLTTFTQWWKRTMRGGHAFAEGAARHGASPQQLWVKEVRSNWAWGAALPALGAAMFVPTLGASALVVAGGYAALFTRLLDQAKARGLGSKEARMYAALHTVAKVPQAVGQAQYWLSRLTKRPPKLIEYKARPSTSSMHMPTKLKPA